MGNLEKQPNRFSQPDIFGKVSLPNKTGENTLKHSKCQQLKKLGFEQLGDIFTKNNFFISVDTNGEYRFHRDYFYYDDLSAVKVIKITNGDHSTLKNNPHLLIIQDLNGTIQISEKTLSGSGISEPLKDNKLPDWHNKPINQQLTETGFIPIIDKKAYSTVFDDGNNGKIDIYALLEDGKIKRIVRQVPKTHPSQNQSIKDLETTLVSFQTKIENGKTYDVLAAKNEAMEFELRYDGTMRITKLLRDIGHGELGIQNFSYKEYTGFIVGGVNENDVISRLPSINGVPIKDLERNMRGDDRDVASLEKVLNETHFPEDPEKLKERKEFIERIRTSGIFLGQDESLIKTLLEDNQYVLNQGLTHQDLGKMIQYTTAIHKVLGLTAFTLKGRSFAVEWLDSFGPQDSPFEDGTKCKSDFTIINQHTGAKLYSSALHGEMITRYGFYEGKQVGYRLEPADIIDVFDFLKEEGRQRLKIN